MLHVNGVAIGRLFVQTVLLGAMQDLPIPVMRHGVPMCAVNNFPICDCQMS